jgi:hypothetical protein
VIAYLGASLFCGIFSFVYERFSHGVYSNSMIFLFLFPLLGGALPHGAILLLGARAPRRVAANLYNSGVATLAVGSCLQGIFEIYGTSSPCVAAYWWAGGALVALGAAAHLLSRAYLDPRVEC